MDLNLVSKIWLIYLIFQNFWLGKKCSEKMWSKNFNSILHFTDFMALMQLSLPHPRGSDSLYNVSVTTFFTRGNSPLSSVSGHFELGTTKLLPSTSSLILTYHDCSFVYIRLQSFSIPSNHFPCVSWLWSHLFWPEQRISTQLITSLGSLSTLFSTNTSPKQLKHHNHLFTNSSM